MNKLTITCSEGKSEIKLDDLEIQGVEYYEVKSSADGTAGLVLRLNVELSKLSSEDNAEVKGIKPSPIIQERIINLNELETQINLAKTNLSIIEKLFNENNLELMKSQLDILNERLNYIENFEFHIEQRKVFRNYKFVPCTSDGPCKDNPCKRYI